ncbi:MAG: hypothetical protein AAGA84_04530 [Pseudomonadota bacterium]
MKRSTRAWFCGLMAASVVACNSATEQLPGIVAESRSGELRVPARGELVASESMPVALPRGLRMAFNISWMVPEFSEVKKGEVVARFDDTQIIQRRETTAFAVAQSDFKLDDIDRTSDLEQVRLGHEAERVEGEREISETYASVDETVFSRNEIIDALSDVEYLNVEAAYLQWQSETFDQRTQAEQDAIVAQQQGDQAMLAQQDQALSMMELRSPADGTFIYARTPWGAKLGKGKNVFPGMPVGNLPIRGKVKARLFVTETDAVGLAADQSVEFRLDAQPSRVFAARITSISAVASPLDREDPQKFFTLEADIDDIDQELMRVGSQLRAEIITGRLDNSIALPSQAVFGDGDTAWVFIAKTGGYEKRDVTLGTRGPDLVEVASGLNAGERVLLVAPEDAG